MKLGSTLAATVFLLWTAVAFAQSESDFYKETIDKHTISKNLKTDYQVNGEGNNSDSEQLQKAIDEAAKLGGGKIIIPAGIYKLGSIALKSNIHLLIDKNAVIVPHILREGKSQTIFSIDNNIENVSIRGAGGRFTVKLPQHKPGITVFRFGYVNNFLLSDFLVLDNLTKFSSAAFGISKGEDGKYHRPKNGVIKNAETRNALYGYGLVQVQAAENVLFKDIAGTGGATLRIETGLTAMNNLQIGGVDRIYGRNISCKDGNAGVMVSPHSMKNGSVDIDGVKTVNCGFGVRIENGFVSKKYTAEGLKPGIFTKVVVKNVDATFGETAQIKPKHYKYIPVYREKLITKTSYDGNESFIGPSIAALLLSAGEYKDNVTVSNIVGHGFLCQKDVITDKDLHSTLDCDQPDK